ncbi:MAG: hypothetical protein HYX75_11450 [Acidobacteria bacterium]|nr:hypothetical protein [Acidobacteriota bacterium]
MGSREESRPTGRVSAAIRDFLTPIVGEFVARTSVNMASKRIGKPPETLTKVDLNPMAEALRPALRTVVGTAADSLVAQIKELSV